ncbi:MAG TPA: glycosyl hydrolase family 28 protein [Bryobacteraceae bacterium]|jgi:hypothetical protein|nr:glycosyl hydrolase family 28 protein [Bryobacteraceae bacterium]
MAQERQTVIRAAAALLTAAVAVCAADFDVKSYGAAGDGRTLDTAAIQKAIDAAGAHGGTVVFPAGRFLSGTITLRSNVTLHLSPGAVLLGSTRMADYNPKHLIYATGVENIAIEGGGTIDGQGDAFLDQNLKPLPRPSPLIEIWDSRNVRIEDITIRRAPAWTIHPKNCDGVKIRGIELLNNLRGINTDGIDIDSTRNAIVSDSHIEAGDDCIVLKTTNRGAAPIEPTENVTVTNCVLVSAASALKLGTESYGDFRHCVFSNCVIRDSRTGIALLAMDGGTMEDIRFQNIVMTTLPKWGQGVEWPIAVEVDKRAAGSRLSQIRDVAFSDLTMYTKGRVLAQGLPESPIENLSFRNILMRMTGYEEIARVKKMSGGAKRGLAGLPDYGPTPAAMIFAYIHGLALDGFGTLWPAGAGPERAAVFGDRLQDVWISGHRDTRTIHIENSTEVHP